jgi:hypothetical protein
MKTKIIGLETSTRYVPEPGDFFTWSDEPDCVCLAIKVPDAVVAADGGYKLTASRLPHVELTSKAELQKFSESLVDHHTFTKLKPSGVDADGTLLFERA